MRIHSPANAGNTGLTLVQKDPMHPGATQPMGPPNYPSQGSRACELQLLSPHVPQEPVLHDQRNQHCKKPMHCNKQQLPLAASKRKPAYSNGDPTRPKINKQINFKGGVQVSQLVTDKVNAP